MATTVHFELDPDEEARFTMLLKEMQLFNPHQVWTISSLAKSLLMEIVNDDLACHGMGDEDEVVAVH